MEFSYFPVMPSDKWNSSITEPGPANIDMSVRHHTHTPIHWAGRIHSVNAGVVWLTDDDKHNHFPKLLYHLKRGSDNALRLWNVMMQMDALKCEHSWAVHPWYHQVPTYHTGKGFPCWDEGPQLGNAVPGSKVILPFFCILIPKWS